MNTVNQNNSDIKAQWLKLDKEYRNRIENPGHYEMDEYFEALISQEDFNFFCEMNKLRNEYFKWDADHQIDLDLPGVIADQILQTKFWHVGRLFSRAYTNWLHDIRISGEDKEIEKDGKLRLNVLFMMRQSSEGVVN
jgi:hypothetical protein